MQVASKFLLYTLQGSLWALNVSEDTVLGQSLIMDGLQDVRTALETDFGDAVLDVNYFHSIQHRFPRERVFLCHGALGLPC